MAYSIMKATRCKDQSWKLTPVGEAETLEKARNAIDLLEGCFGGPDVMYEAHAIE